MLFLGFLFPLLDVPARALWLEMRLAAPPPWFFPLAAAGGCALSTLILTLAFILQERTDRRTGATLPVGGTAGFNPLRHAALLGVGITALRLLMGAMGRVDVPPLGITLRLFNLSVPAAIWTAGGLALVAVVPLLAVLSRLFPRQAREHGLTRAIRLLSIPVAAALVSLPNRVARDVLQETAISAFTGLVVVASLQALLLSALASWLLRRTSVPASEEPAAHGQTPEAPMPMSEEPAAHGQTPEAHVSAADKPATDAPAWSPPAVTEPLPQSLLLPLAFVLSACLLWLSLPRMQTPATVLEASGRQAAAASVRLAGENRPYAARAYAMRAPADADLMAGYALMSDCLFVHEGRPEPDAPRIANEAVPAMDAAIALEPGNPFAQALRAVAVLQGGRREEGIAALKGMLSATMMPPEAKWMAASSLLPVTGDPEVARYLALHGTAAYAGTHEPVRKNTREAASRQLETAARNAVLSAGPAHLESLWLFKRYDALLADAGTVLRHDPGNPSANRFAALADLERSNGSPNYDVAMAALDRLAEAHDGNDEVIRFVLETAMRAGRPDVALRNAEPWYVRHPDSATAAGCYAWALMARAAGQAYGDDDRVAQKLLSEAIAADGESAFLHYHMAEARLKEGAFEEALAEIVAWNAAENTADESPADAMDEGGAPSDENGSEEGENASGSTDETQPEPASAVGARDSLYALAYAYSRHIGEAAADEALVTHAGTWPAFANLVAGIRAQEDKKPEKARQHLEAAWAGGITLPRCSLLLGVSLYECALATGSETQMDRAEHMLRRSTADDPENPNAWYSLGVLFERRQAYDEAHYAYARASLLSQDDTHRQDPNGIGPHARLRMGIIAPLRSEVD